MRSLFEVVAIDFCRALSIDIDSEENNKSSYEAKHKEMLLKFQRWASAGHPIFIKAVKTLSSQALPIMGYVTPMCATCMGAAVAVAVREQSNITVMNVIDKACDIHKEWMEKFMSGEMIVSSDNGSMYMYNGESLSLLQVALAPPLTVRLSLSLLQGMGLREVTEYSFCNTEGLRCL